MLVRRRPPALAIAMCAVALVAGCQSAPLTPATRPAAPTNADLRNPPEVRSVDGVASLTLTAQIDPATGAPALAYRGSLVAPTIRVSPGERIDLTYVDALPASNHEPYNMASLHFHGLSSSPDAPGDDSIGTVAMPGQTLHYEVIVPATQPPGLYFYHSHAHGETDWQTTSGMSGVIVVEGIATIAHETAGLPERIIVLRRPQRTASFPALTASGTTTTGASSCSRSSNEYTTVDGVAAPVSIAIQPGHPQLWRVVNAAADAYYDLSVDGTNLRLVSQDGVPLETYPGARETVVPDVVMPPASRAEFVVDAPRAGAMFRTTCYESGAQGAANPSQVLASITAGQPSLSPVAPPGFREKGTYDEALPAPSARRDLYFAEMPAQAKYYLNGRLYDPSAPPMFVAKSGTVEEWTLYNETSELHAFHIHQTHFVVLDVDGVAQAPAWRDTVNLPVLHPDGTPSVTHVVIDFRNPAIAGTFLFHCHILKHEDGGMMATILVR